MGEQTLAKKDNLPSDLPNCLLSQYRFCTAGLGLGAAYGLKYIKGAPMFPMVAGGVVGTAADLIYGLTFACRDELKQYRNQDGK